MNEHTIASAIDGSAEELGWDPDTIRAWAQQHRPSESEMERVIHEMLEFHGDDWDSLHAFRLLTRPEDRAEVVLHAAIDTAIDPGDYPAMLFGVIGEFGRERDPEDPPLVGCVLQIESFGVFEGGPTPELEEALRRRELHLRPDAVEQCVVIAADASGRAWMASKDRHGGRLELKGPDECAQVGGGLFAAVVACAVALPFMYLGGVDE
jgi:hypothetical protein